jgi:ribosome-associated toxin RatA of RatAB toxin-antitoxin module
MKVVERSALVLHPAALLYALVANVEGYPRFLPWCSGATVEAAKDGIVEATIHVDYRGWRQSFTTRNHHTPHDEIVISLIRGPFKSLDGRWRFTAIDPQASKVALDLRYEFASPFLERLAGPVFGHIASTMMEAFIRRADSVADRQG